MTSSARATPARSAGHLTEPARVVPLVLLGAVVVALSGVVLGNLPLPSTWHLNHGSLPVVADELARTAVLVLVAAAGVAGGLVWRRWAAGAAGLHVLGVALRWALSDGPGGFARIELWRGLAVGVLGLAVAATARPAWLGRGRRWVPAALVVLAGLTMLGGLRQSVTFGTAASVLPDVVRTGGGLAVLVVSVVTAILVARADDDRVAGLHVLGAAVLASGALGGDLAVWWLEGRKGAEGVLALRLAVVLVPWVVGAWLVSAGRRRRAAGAGGERPAPTSPAPVSALGAGAPRR